MGSFSLVSMRTTELSSQPICISKRILLGTGAGGILLPLVIPGIIESVGAAKALRYMSVCIMALLIPLLPFYRGRLPQVRASTQGPHPRGASERKNPFKDVMFLVFMVTNTIQAFAYFVPIIWLPSTSSTSALCLILPFNGKNI